MLLDHFHSPLKDTRPWTGFHGMWAGKLAAAISRLLPDGWFAAPIVHGDVEIDVAALEHQESVQAVGQIAESLVIPEPTQTVSFAFATDVVEVQVFRDLGELVLVGAIEFVSPANKDRPENRAAFVAKCDALLRNEVGLVIVDIATNRRANLHADLMERLGEPFHDDNHIYPYLSCILSASHDAVGTDTECMVSSVTSWGRDPAGDSFSRRWTNYRITVDGNISGILRRSQNRTAGFLTDV